MKDHKLVPVRPPESILAVVRKAYGNATAYDVGHVWHEIYTRLPDAAPVQEPVTEQMKDHKCAELVNNLRAIAIAFHAHGPLRERIAAEIRPLFRAAQPRKAVKLTDSEVREIYLANGFTVKDGQTGLKPYVFESARAIEAAVLKANGVEE